MLTRHNLKLYTFYLYLATSQETGKISWLSQHACYCAERLRLNPFYIPELLETKSICAILVFSLSLIISQEYFSKMLFDCRSVRYFFTNSSSQVNIPIFRDPTCSNAPSLLNKLHNIAQIRSIEQSDYVVPFN